MRLVTLLVLGASGLTLLGFFAARVTENAPAFRVGMVFVLLLLAVGGLATLAAGTLRRALDGVTSSLRLLSTATAPGAVGSGIHELDALDRVLTQAWHEVHSLLDAVEESERDSSIIIEAMSEGVIAADPDGRIRIANPAARRILCYGEHEPLPELTTIFRARVARQAVEDALAGQEIHDRELEFGALTLMLNARSLGDRGVVLVLHDLSEVRRLEVVRRDFVANASHELKTPLTSITGYAETLAADDSEIDPVVRRSFLTTIRSNASRMQALLDDLLDLSRIESGHWTPDPALVNLAELVRESWHLLQIRAEARQAKFLLVIGKDAETLHIDPRSLHQILGNLLDNALRYIADGGSVTVRSEILDQGLLISVEDNGSGIPMEHLPRIFERFYRVNPSRSREEGGTGLGLAIVKHLVEAQGGWIKAESQLGEGTAIRCWFPTGEESARFT